MIYDYELFIFNEEEDLSDYTRRTKDYFGKSVQSKNTGIVINLERVSFSSVIGGKINGEKHV